MILYVLSIDKTGLVIESEDKVEALLQLEVEE